MHNQAVQVKHHLKPKSGLGLARMVKLYGPLAVVKPLLSQEYTLETVSHKYKAHQSKKNNK